MARVKGGDGRLWTDDLTAFCACKQRRYHPRERV